MLLIVSQAGSAYGLRTWARRSFIDRSIAMRLVFLKSTPGNRQFLAALPGARMRGSNCRMPG
jgi:hypothetical protein